MIWHGVNWEFIWFEGNFYLLHLSYFSILVAYSAAICWRPCIFASWQYSRICSLNSFQKAAMFVSTERSYRTYWYRVNFCYLWINVYSKYDLLLFWYLINIIFGFLFSSEQVINNYPTQSNFIRPYNNLYSMTKLVKKRKIRSQSKSLYTYR